MFALNTMTMLSMNTFFILKKIFKQIKECEDGRDINKILETPVSYSGFKRLN